MKKLIVDLAAMRDSDDDNATQLRSNIVRDPPVAHAKAQLSCKRSDQSLDIGLMQRVGTKPIEYRIYPTSNGAIQGVVVANRIR